MPAIPFSSDRSPRPLRLPPALPHLRGWWGRVVLWAYLACALLTAIAVVGSVSFNGLDLFRNVPGDMRYGFRTLTDPDHPLPVVGGVSPGAALAGLRPGDRVLAVGDRTMPAGATEFDIGAAMDEASADPLPLTTADAAGARRVIRLPRATRVWLARDPVTRLPVWMLALCGFLFVELPALVLLVASTTLYLRRPHDPQAMLLAFAFLPGCWAPDTAFWLTALAGVPRAVLVAITVLGWPLLLAALAGFPDGRYATIAGRIAAVGAGLLVMLDALILARLVSGVAAHRVYLAVFALSAGAAILSVLVRYVRLRPGLKHQQMKWALFAAVLMALAALANEMALPWILPLLAPEAAALLAGLVLLLSYTALPIGLLVAVLGYRLYDTEAAISRSTSLAVLTIALLAVFGGVQNTIASFGQKMVGGTMGSFSGTTAAALTYLTGGMLAGRIRAWADRIFRQHLTHLQTGLPALVGDLRETEPPAALREAVLARVADGVRARWLALADADRAITTTRGIAPAAVAGWLAGYHPTKGGIDGNKADPLFPVRVPLVADGAAPVGWLLVGPRPDGSYYGKDERRVLGEIADPVARALAIASAREDMTAAVDRRLAALEDALAALLDQGRQVRG